jgi:dihydropteroate synthase
VRPVVAGLANALSLPVSIDTWKAEVAEAALRAGAAIVNDIWGAQREPAIAEVAARYGAPMVLMHNRDTIDPDIDIFDDVLRFLERSIVIATAAGPAAAARSSSIPASASARPRRRTSP